MDASVGRGLKRTMWSLVPPVLVLVALCMAWPSLLLVLGDPVLALPGFLIGLLVLWLTGGFRPGLARLGFARVAASILSALAVGVGGVFAMFHAAPDFGGDFLGLMLSVALILLFGPLIAVGGAVLAVAVAGRGEYSLERAAVALVRLVGAYVGLMILSVLLSAWVL